MVDSGRPRGDPGRAVADARRPCSGLLSVAVCALLFVAAPACDQREQTPFPSPYVIEVTGSDFRWDLRYPGDDGRLHTGDDLCAERHIHVPANSRIRLELRSEDYLYQLGFPGLGLKEIAVPDLEFSMEFESGDPGTHELLGGQFCGYTHPDLKGELVVLPPAEFREWARALAGR